MKDGVKELERHDFAEIPNRQRRVYILERDDSKSRWRYSVWSVFPEIKEVKQRHFHSLNAASAVYWEKVNNAEKGGQIAAED